MARIGWLVTGGVTLVTGIVLMLVMNTHDSRSSVAERGCEPREYPDIEIDGITIRGGVLTPETRKRLNEALATLIKTRNLKEKLSGIESHVGSSPTLEVLGKDFADVRDPELKMQASEAGGELLERYNRAVKEVTRRDLEALRAAANAAALGTTGEALAPYGPLEDATRLLLHEAMANKDAEAEAIYQLMWYQTCREIDGIVTKLFNESYQNRVPWNDLLADTAGWTIASSGSFKHTFGAGLSLVNAPGEQSGSSGLRYTPADEWRDYVLEVEFKLDSGTLVFYTRIGDKMDPKEVPAFSVGTKDATIQVEYGKTCRLVIRMIGNRLTVTGEDTSYAEDFVSTKSRRGEPGIVAEAGTTATITRLRARHLR